MIWIWFGVVSGKASSGKFTAEFTPTYTSKPARSNTKKRFRRLNPIRALSIGEGLDRKGWRERFRPLVGVGCVASGV